MRARKVRGGAIVELAAVLWLLPVMAIMAVNIGVLIFGAWVNDAACRDGARAAAQQFNASDAKVAAVKAVETFKIDSKIVTAPKVLTVPPNFEFETFPDTSGKPQLEKGPYVKVTTVMSAKLPAPVLFNGVEFTDNVIFKQQYIYPIVQPNYTNRPSQYTPVPDES